MREIKFMSLQQHKRIIISGGGTGGHIFPAISIANALRRIDPAAEILFVGAEGRLEMERVPEAGYQIKGLPVSGFLRKLTFKNVKVVINLFRSLRLAKKILTEFRPDVVVGVGGYASGPVLRQAGKMGIPTLIQEQNSYAGVTNKLLVKKASVICVAYDGMEKYFPAEKIIKTGNPVRLDFQNLGDIRNKALEFFGLEKGKPVILILGGSGGAGTINMSLSQHLGKISSSGCQWLWQTGKFYYDRVSAEVSRTKPDNVVVSAFINRMDYAYSAADVIVTRSGAGTISELCLVGKPVILIPSPNVAGDHQTKNARALSDRNAAILITDRDAPEKLVDEAIKLVSDEAGKAVLAANIKQLAVRDSDIRIAKEVLKLAGHD
jgi:UDP-N-acetylglucosamine--N-acetylmuramyl-(pentapeptide) pyrophosphoryl-undecaprenol N-acetylglucosamine transferase